MIEQLPDNVETGSPLPLLGREQEEDVLKKAYDPDRFNRAGHQLVELLTDYLSSSMEATKPLNEWVQPVDQYAYWSKELETPDDNLQTLFQKYLDRALKIHHRHYMGHQVAVPAPDAALTGLLGNLLNNVAVVYEMGPGAVAMERAVIKRVARTMGFDDCADGFMTSGGTLSNLTSLLAIRSIKSQNDVWSQGNKGVQYAILVSEEAHYCVERAVRVMGWGDEGVVKVPVGSDYKMRTDLLPSLLAQARAQGKEVLGVVGCACSTSTGIYDDLDAIGDFCRQENLWFHVDAAHGGPALFSPEYKYLLKGIEKADSVIMDFHKMMMTPALATAVVFRNGGDSYQAFAQRAQYLWEQTEEPEWWNLGQRSYECTKLMMGVKVFTLFKCYGDTLFSQYIERTYGMGQRFAQMVRNHPRMELALSPETNVVCFRYRPDREISDAELSDLNGRIRKAMLEKANFYMLQTRLKNDVWLRITIMNPFTTEEDLAAMLDEAVLLGDRLQI